MTDCTEHRVIINGIGGAFRLINKDGKELLPATQVITVQELVALVAKDKESR